MKAIHLRKIFLISLTTFCSTLAMGESFEHNGNTIYIEKTVDIEQIPEIKQDSNNLIMQVPQIDLFPRNGNRVTLSITLTYSDGSPASGIPVSVYSSYNSLSDSKWRTIDGLAQYYADTNGAGNVSTIRSRYASKNLKLRAPFSPESGSTNAQGIFQSVVENFHVCGNESQPGSDLINFSVSGGLQVVQWVVRCVTPNLVSISDNASGGLTTSGLVGRHLHSEVLARMQDLGLFWRDNVTGKPAGMPNYLVITGASMRWGGMNPPHLSHKWGVAVDVRPIGTTSGRITHDSPYYHKQGTQILIDLLRQLGATRVVFADGSLNGVDVVRADHSDHIHVSFITEYLEPWLVPGDDEEAAGDFGDSSYIDGSALDDPAYFIPEPHEGALDFVEPIDLNDL